MSSLSLKNRFLSVKLQTYTDFFNSMPADACCGNIQPPSDWHTRTLCITMCVGRVLTVNTECECTATLTLSYTHTHIQTFWNENFLSFLRPNFQLYVQVFRIWKKKHDFLHQTERKGNLVLLTDIWKVSNGTRSPHGSNLEADGYFEVKGGKKNHIYFYKRGRSESASKFYPKCLTYLFWKIPLLV